MAKVYGIEAKILKKWKKGNSKKNADSSGCLTIFSIMFTGTKAHVAGNIREKKVFSLGYDDAVKRTTMQFVCVCIRSAHSCIVSIHPIFSDDFSTFDNLLRSALQIRSHLLINKRVISLFFPSVGIFFSCFIFATTIMCWTENSVFNEELRQNAFAKVFRQNVLHWYKHLNSVSLVHSSH